MSVRRLVQDSIQPATFKFNTINTKWAQKTIEKYPKGRQASAVIPLLMRAQDQEGWLTKASIEATADMLDMPYIRVLEVATFYTQFQLQPVGTKAHVQVCGTTPCMLRGANELIAVCKKKIDPNQFQTNEDGSLSWEEVECQGVCVNGPMIMIFRDTYEDLTPKRLEEIIESFQVGKGDRIKPGPQIDRIYSAPIGGPTCLTADPNIKKPKQVTSKKEASQKAPARTKIASTKAKSSMSSAIALKDKNRPESIKKPVRVDDLKQISGIGPKLEGVLHDLGIYTFAQIAGWKKMERDWIDTYLKFKGRIERDDWVKQSRVLMRNSASG